MTKTFSKLNTMPKHFKLAGNTIDVARGEVKTPHKVHQLEPKVMAVLLFLIANKGEVVSQEEIFFQVWPNSIFNPSSIQRCITILRKAFNDDAKQQSFIVTHPKRGYSLIPQMEPLIDPARTIKIKIFLSLIAIAICSIIFLFTNHNLAYEPFKIGHMQPVTTAGKNNRFSVFSPNNQYIAFIRQKDKRDKTDTIWLKDLVSEQEMQLSQIESNIMSLSWSADSKALLFTTKFNKSVSIKRIQISNKHTQEIMKLNDLVQIRKVHWGKNNHIYYLATDKLETRLHINNLTTGEHQILFTGNKNFKPYAITLNKEQSRIAIVGFNKELANEIKLLTIEKNRLIHTKQLATLTSNVYSIDWHPDNQSLLISDGRKLLQLSIKGKQTDLNFNNYDYILTPSFNADASAITLTKEKIDSDINQIPLNGTAFAQEIINTNSADYAPSLSPDGSKMIFISERNGYPQLYLYNLNTQENRVIFNNPERKLYLAPPIWHPEKPLISSAINDKLILIELHNKKVKLTITETTIGHPKQWYYNENALLMVNYSGKSQSFIKYNLTTHTATTVEIAQNKLAFLTDNNLILLFDKNKILRVNNPSDNDILHTVDGEIINVIAKDLGMYIQIEKNHINTLWYLDFEQLRLTKHVDLPKNTHLVSDIHIQRDIILFESSEISHHIILLSGR